MRQGADTRRDEGDAYLIAAAPELLAAAKVALGTLACFHAVNDGTTALEAAIALAEGSPMA